METSLYLPVKRYLEKLGFTVKGEIGGCDLVALSGDEPPIVVIGELKLSFNLEVVLQAVDRAGAADEVWVAARLSARGKGRESDARYRNLCRRLGFVTGDTLGSASEAVINGLRGIDVEVIQIGSTTCGKPYGFYPTDNCGTTYFSIEFKGENAKGFGDYSDGFMPVSDTPANDAQVPGCMVADDFTHALGDASEARLAAALSYRAGTGCPVAATGRGKMSGAVDLAAASGRLVRSPLFENLILSHANELRKRR